MIGPKPGSRPGCVIVDGPEPGELWWLQDLDFWTAGALNGRVGDGLSDETCILPGGVIRGRVWRWVIVAAVAVADERPGEELRGSTADNREGSGILQTGMDVERELLGELE
jgi:hypothetical protein